MANQSAAKAPDDPSGIFLWRFLGTNTHPTKRGEEEL
eukprot:CAMPEP_0197599520 /NCGR_PEP_ID=MMETSP1326-20131121/31540_1 /TAXON_ID=1155430 /ORGANISM="Genus nov. species nov., Strain RCC2288" /LENGTH=36 /DNA_ID= /DNA_START= /DNA_END= /DNA_ORIENTATION=